MKRLTRGRAFHSTGLVSRWPFVGDALLATLVVVLYALELHPPVGEPPTILGPFTRPDAVAHLLVVLFLGGSLLWRRRAPLLAMAVVLLASYAYEALGYIPLAAVDLSALVAVYAVGSNSRWASSAGVTLAVAGWLIASQVVNPTPFQVQEVVILLVVFVGAYALGRSARARRLYSTALERERELLAARAVAEERAAIARELHDVVAHHISVVVLQAGAARLALDDDRRFARSALDAIEASGRQALSEMRRLLGVLRPLDGDGPTATIAPQPSLAALPDLVSSLRGAGLEVELFVEGAVRSLPAGVELSAYRVVQEALTNALRHGRARVARVHVRYGERELEIEVVDGLAAGALVASAQPGLAGGAERLNGHGLLGMRERVTMLGGELELHSLLEGGYRVRARLPLLAGDE